MFSHRLSDRGENPRILSKSYPTDKIWLLTMETVNAVPVFLLFGCVAGLAVALFAIAALFNPRQFVGPVQKMPYESGMDPIHDTRRRFDVRFHLIAIAFLVFDVEVLFLYPWAVAAKRPDAAAAPVGRASSSRIKAGKTARDMQHVRLKA